MGDVVWDPPSAQGLFCAYMPLCVYVWVAAAVQFPYIKTCYGSGHKKRKNNVSSSDIRGCHNESLKDNAMWASVGSTCAAVWLPNTPLLLVTSPPTPEVRAVRSPRAPQNNTKWNQTRLLSYFPNRTKHHEKDRGYWKPLLSLFFQKGIWLLLKLHKNLPESSFSFVTSEHCNYCRRGLSVLI